MAYAPYIDPDFNPPPGLIGQYAHNMPVSWSVELCRGSFLRWSYQLSIGSELSTCRALFIPCHRVGHRGGSTNDRKEPIGTIGPNE